MADAYFPLPVYLHEETGILPYDPTSDQNYLLIGE